ncbi:hypothetical protein LCGC14_1062460 [marine sediment metagenome]|uniref:NAD-dependent epimerase/dehydratase domain-containing protein n=1 Tax=marine sediment metagenome TaxID=412755 RepID=A0A0F9QRN1_9ZZZZ
MKILITGGAGFVGSNLAHFLAGKGHEIHVVDDLSEGNIQNIEDLIAAGKCKFHRENAFHTEIKSDIIYHLACQKMIYSIRKPREDLYANTATTVNILELARKQDIPVVFTSTGSVYGNPTVFPTPEDYPPDPESPYGVSKWAAEEYCKLYHKMYGLNVVIARLFSVYGPRQRFIGVIPKFIKQTLEGKPMTVEGDGTQSRTFTYVDDCVEVLILLSEKGVPGEVYNIAGEKPYSIAQISKTIADLYGDYGIKFVSRKKGDLDQIHPSTEKIRALGWRPKIDMETGIRKTMEWIKNG